MLALVLAPLVIIVVAWFLNYLWFERHLRKFPGPTPLPILGSALDFASAKNRLKQLLEYREKYKGDFKVYMGFEPFLFLSEVKSMEVILSSNIELTKSKQYKFLKNWMGNGLLISDGDYWRRHRKLITPAFHFQILEKYVDAFNSATDIFVDSLRSKVGKEAIDIHPYTQLLTLDIMCESAMGISVNAQLNPESKYASSAKEAVQILFKRMFSPILQYDALYRLSGTYQKEMAAVKVLHEYVRKVISKKKFENENSEMDFEEELASKKKLAFLDLLLNRNSFEDGLTDDELREEVDTLLFEGHDTTASALAFTMYCLSNHQVVQDKVYKEVVSVLSEDITRLPTYKDLNELRYLELVIKETLRMYPTAPFYLRQLSKNVQCGDKILPKGMTISLFAMGIQRDPKLFPNPDVFDPDRFLPENSKGRNPYSYVPFSAGPRNCIGQKFAMLEMKSTISTVLRNYKLMPLTPVHKVDLWLETVLKSHNGVMMRLEKRN